MGKPEFKDVQKRFIDFLFLSVLDYFRSFFAEYSHKTLWITENVKWTMIKRIFYPNSNFRSRLQNNVIRLLFFQFIMRLHGNFLKMAEMLKIMCIILCFHGDEVIVFSTSSTFPKVAFPASSSSCKRTPKTLRKFSLFTWKRCFVNEAWMHHGGVRGQRRQCEGSTWGNCENCSKSGQSLFWSMKGAEAGSALAG